MSDAKTYKDALREITPGPPQMSCTESIRELRRDLRNDAAVSLVPLCKVPPKESVCRLHGVGSGGGICDGGGGSISSRSIGTTTESASPPTAGDVAARSSGRGRAGDALDWLGAWPRNEAACDAQSEGAGGLREGEV